MTTTAEKTTTTPGADASVSERLLASSEELSYDPVREVDWDKLKNREIEVTALYMIAGASGASALACARRRLARRRAHRRRRPRMSLDCIARPPTPPRHRARARRGPR